MTEEDKRNPVRSWTVIVLACCVVIILWQMRSDRITPMSTQARVHAQVVPIAPEVAGTVASVSVGNNQRVEAGQELFRLDATQLQYSLQQAQAGLRQAYQGQGAADANIEAARANVDSARVARDRALRDSQRIRRMNQKDPGVISQSQLEAAIASHELAEGKLDAAEAAYQAALQQRGTPDSESSEVQQAQAALESAERDLEVSIVRAPGRGVVTGVQLDKGKFAAAGQAQMTFVSTHSIWLQADFKENNLAYIDAEDRVEIVFDMLPGQVISGTVREVGYGVDLGNPPLGQLPTISNDNSWLRPPQRFPVLVDFEIPTDDKGEVRLKVGSQANVLVYTGRNPVFNAFAFLRMRFNALISYAY